MRYWGMKPKHSAQQNQRMWCIRAGTGDRAHLSFLELKVVGLSDPGMGDLRKIPPDRQSFYAAYQRLRPHETRTGITGIAGKFFRFAHEITIEDLIVYPSRNENRVYVGRVTGQYKYSNQQIEDPPHQRSVKWLCNFSKSRLSKTAQRELGAARTFFEVKRHSVEISRLVTQLICANSQANALKN